MRRGPARWILIALVALVGQIVGVGLLRPASAAAQVPPVPVYLQVNAPPYQCLTSNSDAAGTPVVLGACTRWEAVYLDDTMWAIRKPGTNQCLTVRQWRCYDAILYPCYGYGDQQWIPDYLIGDPWHLPTLVRLHPQSSPNRCLTAPTWHSPLLWDCLPYSDQEFWVIA